MGFLGISFEQSADTWFVLQTGFEGISFVPPAVKAVAVTIADNIGNIDTFAITNASLGSSTAAFPSVPLSFAINTWTANETIFYAGIEPSEIRINFDIAGVTFAANAFNFSVIEAIPNLIEI